MNGAILQVANIRFKSSVRFLKCPLEWKPVREEIEGVKGNLTNTYDEVIDYIGGRAAPVDGLG